MKRTEQSLQIAVVALLDAVLPRGSIVHHSPNGGGRSRAEAGLFRAMGTRAGWPDLVVLCPGVRPVFIELKAGKGRLSDAQADMRDALLALGFGWRECRHEVEVIDALRAEGVRLRGGIAA